MFGYFLTLRYSKRYWQVFSKKKESKDKLLRLLFTNYQLPTYFFFPNFFIKISCKVG